MQGHYGSENEKFVFMYRMLILGLDIFSINTEITGLN